MSLICIFLILLPRAEAIFGFAAMKEIALLQGLATANWSRCVTLGMVSKRRVRSYGSYAGWHHRSL